MTAYHEIIEDVAERYRLDPDWIRAIIYIESGWDAMPTPRWEVAHQEHSYGLGQVLPSTALWMLRSPSLFPLDSRIREEGLESQRKQFEDGEASLNRWLHKPTVGIELIAAYLTYNLRRYNWNISDAVAAYNAGSVRRTNIGTYVNQWHVDKFHNALDMYKGV